MRRKEVQEGRMKEEPKQMQNGGEIQMKCEWTWNKYYGGAHAKIQRKRKYEKEQRQKEGKMKSKNEQRKDRKGGFYIYFALYFRYI